MVTGLVVKKTITYQHFKINLQRWHNISHKHVGQNNPVCILNIHVMYFNFTKRLLELEGVSSKQTYLGVVE